MKSLEDMQRHVKTLEAEQAQLNRLLNEAGYDQTPAGGPRVKVVSDTRYEGDKGVTYFPLYLVRDLLEIKRDRINGELMQLNKALRTATDVARGLLNRVEDDAE